MFTLFVFIISKILMLHLVYAAAFKVQRYGQGIFRFWLEDLFKRLYNREPEITQFGKPHRNTMEYCQKILDKKAKDEGYEISQYYMIGDNPSGDIKGANDMGWRSVLVKTGNYQPKEGQENDLDHPAHYVVEDFNEAIELILKEEDIL